MQIKENSTQHASSSSVTVENEGGFLYLEHILREYKMLNCSTGVVEDLFPGLFAGTGGTGD